MQALLFCCKQAVYTFLRDMWGKISYLQASNGPSASKKGCQNLDGSAYKSCLGPESIQSHVSTNAKYCFIVNANKKRLRMLN